MPPQDRHQRTGRYRYAEPALTAQLMRKGAMPRKRPGIIRQARAHRATWRTEPHVPGLPGSAQQEVSQIELWTAQDWARFGLWPGAVAEAFTGWSATSNLSLAAAF